MKTQRSKRKENLTAKQCASIFKKQLKKSEKDPTTIQNEKGKNFVLKPKETWKQCYANEPGRDQFPRYLFATSSKRVLSVMGKDRVKWLTPSGIGKNSTRLGYIISHNGKKKFLPYYDLMALVFGEEVGAEVYGEAKKALEEFGYDALGMDEGDVNGHHVDGYDEKEAKKFKRFREKIEFVSLPVHKLLHGAPSLEHDDKKKEIEYMKDFSKTVSKEEPDSNSIMIITETKNPDGTVSTKSKISTISDEEIEKQVDLERIRLSIKAKALRDVTLANFCNNVKDLKDSGNSKDLVAQKLLIAYSKEYIDKWLGAVWNVLEEVE